jgi:hypothetical protein
VSADSDTEQAPDTDDVPDQGDVEPDDDHRPWLTWRGRLAVLGACLVLAAVGVWFAGTDVAPSRPDPPAGSVRLGPDPGQPVADYLAQLPGRLPAPGAVAPALVQLTAAVDPGTAAALVRPGTTAGIAVLQVQLPRVQTALRFQPVDPALPTVTALQTVREQARRAADGDVVRLTGRPHDVAVAEAAALADPGCRCVLALVVHGDLAALQALATTPGVRAVDAAPVGVTDRELALSPLLPGQRERADPVPDDGAVPPA